MELSGVDPMLYTHYTGLPTLVEYDDTLKQMVKLLKVFRTIFKPLIEAIDAIVKEVEG